MRNEYNKMKIFVFSCGESTVLGTYFFFHLKTADFTESCLCAEIFQLLLSRLFSGRINWGDETHPL